MKARAVGLTIAGLISILAAVPCTAEPPPERPNLPIEGGGGGGDDGGGGGNPGPSDYCALTAVACIAGIAGLGPACASCVTVAGCIACAGDAAGTVSSCLSYSDNCISRNAVEGDLCSKSNRCETGGLHCVNHHCTANRGSERERCSTERDCQPGMICQLDEVGNAEGGQCWRLRGNGELCAASAECQAPLICDPANHTCRAATCGEVIGAPTNTQDCPCVIDDGHPAPQGNCAGGYKCEGGRCTQVTVHVCACDGTDAPGTCTSCDPPPVGGGPTPPTFFYYPTCYYFYEAFTYYTCATYGNHTECGSPQTEFQLVDSFCI